PSSGRPPASSVPSVRARRATAAFRTIGPASGTPRSAASRRARPAGVAAERASAHTAPAPARSSSHHVRPTTLVTAIRRRVASGRRVPRSEEHTSELQSLAYLVCRLLLEKKKK